jgi:hypothetical protein
MPSLTCTKVLGAVRFHGHGLKLPSQWKPFPGERGSKAGPPRVAPPWFTPAANVQDHQEICDEIGEGFRELHDTLCDAVASAHELWRLGAQFKDLKINGASVFGQEGCLDGPQLADQILAYPDCAGWVGNKATYRDAVAQGVSQCFATWQRSVSVPGLLWYPAFAAFAGAQAPPTANVPSPLSACVAKESGQIANHARLYRAMYDHLAPEMKKGDTEKHHEAFLDGIANVLSLAFTTWLAAQQVTQVLGRGPVPSGNGPVVGGTIVSAPGHLIA